MVISKAPKHKKSIIINKSKVNDSSNISNPTISNLNESLAKLNRKLEY